MYISSDQKMVIRRENMPFLQHVIHKHAAKTGKEKRSPNYATLFHRCGIRHNNRVLVIGGENTELLQKMAKTVGWRGQITVLDSREWVLEELQALADAGSFHAFKPNVDRHPAFDKRPQRSRFVPIQFRAQRLDLGQLPFADGYFDMLWVETLPAGLTESQFEQMNAELERVSKN